METRSYFWMLSSPVIFSTFVFAHSLCFSAQRRRCGSRAVLVHCHCHWSAEQSWSYPENNILHGSVLKRLVFAMLVLKHVIFPYSCKGRDSVEVKMGKPRRREARLGSQLCTVWSWPKKGLNLPLLCPLLSTCNVLWCRGWKISLSLERSLCSKQNHCLFVFISIIAPLVKILVSQAWPHLERLLLRFH